MRNVSRNQFWPKATSMLRPAHALLDIGPGIRPQTLVACGSHICIEPYSEYSSILTRDHPGCIVIGATWAEALELLGPESVDTIVLLDVIEHLPKHESRTLLDRSVRVARSQIIVFTPLGFMPQGDSEAKDAWGLDGGDWQVHKSGWIPEDFPGWNLLVCEDYHRTDAYGRPLDSPFGALFAVLDKGTGFDAGSILNAQQRRIVHEAERLARQASGPTLGQRVIRRLVRLLQAR